MKLNIQITHFNVEIKVAVRNDNIKAFVNWNFYTNEGVIKIKGGTIRLKEFSSKQLLSYDPPCIRTFKGFMKAFYFDNLKLYQRFCYFTIKKYSAESGDVTNFVDVEMEEQVKEEDIPH